jgi:hypothetical protein
MAGSTSQRVTDEERIRRRYRIRLWALEPRLAHTDRSVDDTPDISIAPRRVAVGNTALWRI